LTTNKTNNLNKDGKYLNKDSTKLLLLLSLLILFSIY